VEPFKKWEFDSLTKTAVTIQRTIVTKLFSCVYTRSSTLCDTPGSVRGATDNRGFATAIAYCIAPKQSCAAKRAR
jgi:hypothetical protein